MMTLAQALGAAAAALFFGLSAGGAAPGRAMVEIAAETRAALTPAPHLRCASALNVERWLRADAPSFACAVRR